MFLLCRSPNSYMERSMWKGTEDPGYSPSWTPTCQHTPALSPVSKAIWNFHHPNVPAWTIFPSRNLFSTSCPWHTNNNNRHNSKLLCIICSAPKHTANWGITVWSQLHGSINVKGLFFNPWVKPYFVNLPFLSYDKFLVRVTHLISAYWVPTVC